MSPCPGKCFAQAATPTPAGRSTKAATCRATSSGSAPKRAHADRPGWPGSTSHVRDRREVEVDAGRGELAGDRAATAGSARRRRRRRARGCPGTSSRRAASSRRHVAALLVDRDQELGPLGAQRAGQRARAAPGRSTLRAKSTTPPSPSASQRASQSGGSSPGKPGSRQAAAARASSRLIRGRRRPSGRRRSALHDARRRSRPAARSASRRHQRPPAVPRSCVKFASQSVSVCFSGLSSRT